MYTPILGKWLLNCCLLIAVLSPTILSAHAEQPLTLDEAVQLATQNQPLLQSYDVAAASSREAAVAAEQLPDPRLKFGVINLPVTSSDAGRFNRDDMTMTTIGVMQDVVPQQKRLAAAKQMQASSEQYHAEQSAVARSIQRDVALAWLDVYEAQRNLEVYQRISGEMSAERKVIGAKEIDTGFSSAGGQAVEALKLETQLAMNNDKRLVAKRDEQKARAMLARWIGVAATRPLAYELPVHGYTNGRIHGTTNDAANEGRSDANAQLESHPLVMSAIQSENVALSDADRARTERLQNWSWELMYGKRRTDLSDMVSFQVTMDLPWDRANRQDRRTAEKQMLAEKAHKLVEDRRRELSAELESARADWDIAKAREQEHQARLIPAAEARLSVTQAGYSAGKQSLADVWEARRGVIEAEREHWSILTDQQRAAVKLAYLLSDSSLFPNPSLLPNSPMASTPMASSPMRSTAMGNQP